jgi:hypothetical protein
MADQPLDLTSSEVTRRLLRDPRDWRERAVETLRVGSAQFVMRERSLQCRPLFGIVEDLLGGQASPAAGAFVVLPLALLPKQPLLEFGVEGPSGQPVLLRRPEIAEREAALLEGYAREAGLAMNGSITTLLPILLGFTEGSWAAVKADAGRREDALRTYLDQGLTRPLEDSQLERLRSASNRAHVALDGYNESDPATTSAVESPFLAVPVLIEDKYVPGAEAAVRSVEDYAVFVETALEQAQSATPSPAGDLLSVLADYGRHWELMVLAEVPLDRPFTMSYRYLDPAPVTGWRNTISPAVVIADADSNHVAISITDPGTRLVDVVGHHPRTGQVAEMGSTSRQADEMHAFYVWEVAVDFRVLLSTRLGVLKRVAVANALLAVVVGLVAAALVLRAPTTLSELGIVAGPTAAAASLLLLREPSTLASRLRLPYSAAIAAAVLALVVVAVWRFTTLP